MVGLRRFWNDQLQKEIELAGLRGNKAVETLANSIAISGNPKLAENLNRIIEVRSAMVEETQPFVPSPEDEKVADGEVILGQIVHGDLSIAGEVRIPINQFSEGWFVTGATGQGKTYYIAFLLSQLLRFVRSWVFDREAEFSQYLTDEVRSGAIEALGYRDVKRNLLEPMPGEEPNEAINRIVSGWRESLFLRDGSANLLTLMIRELYEKKGVYQGTYDYPCLYELHEALKKLRFKVNSRNAGYWETLTNRTTHLLNQMSQTYDCVKGYDIRELLDHSIIFELLGLSTFLHQFFVQDLVSCAQAYRERFPSRELKNIFVVDEIHRLVGGPRSIRNDLGEPFLHTVARTTRKRGIGLLVADQVPSGLPSAYMANLGTSIVFRLTNGPCIRTIGDSMSLDLEQRTYLPELARRRAVLRHPSVPRPFLIEVPELSFGYEDSDVEIKERMAPVVEQLVWVPRFDGNTHTNQGEQTAYEDRTKAERNQPRKNELAPLTKEALDYLEAITKQPFKSATERDRKIGMSTYKGNRLRGHLAKEGLIKIHQVNTGKRGGVVTLVETTDEGRGILKVYHVDFKRPGGKGSFVHQFWQHKVQEWFLEKYPDCKAVIEQSIEGKAVDIGVEVEGKRLAVEILIKDENKELTNIVKDLDTGWDEVVVCCEDREAIKRLKRKLEEEFGDKYSGLVNFKELREFVI